MAPYFDPTLQARYAAATRLPASLDAWFRQQPAYKAAVASLRDVHGLAQRAVTRLNGASIKEFGALRKAIEDAKDKPKLPAVELTLKITAIEAADVVFDSRDDFVTATRKLQTIKRLSPDTDDGVSP